MSHSDMLRTNCAVFISVYALNESTSTSQNTRSSTFETNAILVPNSPSLCRECKDTKRTLRARCYRRTTEDICAEKRRGQVVALLRLVPRPPVARISPDKGLVVAQQRMAPLT